MPIFNQGYALVIGVGDYVGSSFASLPATQSDAKEVYNVLTDPTRCGYAKEQVRLLIGPDADLFTITTELARLAKVAPPDATVIIYFSGHGGRTTELISDIFLCPREADINDLEHTALSQIDFATALGKIRARKTLVLLDCCYAGGAALKSGDSPPTWKSGLSEHDLALLAKGQGRVLIASSERDKPSMITGSSSLFTRHLVDGLKGAAPASEDGTIGVLSLFTYVAKRVQQVYYNQQPVMHADSVNSDFPVAFYRGGQKGGGDTLPDEEPDTMTTRPAHRKRGGDTLPDEEPDTMTTRPAQRSRVTNTAKNVSGGNINQAGGNIVEKGLQGDDLQAVLSALMKARREADE